jgi:CarD family transcriptional regulator
MEFKLGEKVVYPNHGVGVIEQISYGSVNGRSERFYMLKILSSGLKVMVPQTNVDCVGLRPIIRNTQAGAVISFLEKGRSASHHDWKHRFKENSDRMRTGSLMEVAAVLKGLVALSRTKPLSFREKKMLELATVRNTSESTVEANLIRALAKAKLQMPEASPIPE